MNDLLAKFKQAQEDVLSLSERPNNAVLLKLYALFKQATSGDASGDKPGMFDLIAKRKFEAWEQFRGMSKDDAMQTYIDEVKRLLDGE